LLDHTDIGSVLHNKSASRGHLCDSTAFLFLLAEIPAAVRSHRCTTYTRRWWSTVTKAWTCKPSTLHRTSRHW